jgi:hypothetical protein
MACTSREKVKTLDLAIIALFAAVVAVFLFR